jgi:hypothetical protein
MPPEPFERTGPSIEIEVPIQRPRSAKSDWEAKRASLREASSRAMASSGGGTDQPTLRTRAPEPSSSGRGWIWFLLLVALAAAAGGWYWWEFGIP